MVRPKPRQAGQAHARVEMKEELMQEVDRGAHACGYYPGESTGQRRQHNQARFTRPNDGTQSLRYFQSTDEPIDHESPRCRAPLGLA